MTDDVELGDLAFTYQELPASSIEEREQLNAILRAKLKAAPEVFRNGKKVWCDLSWLSVNVVDTHSARLVCIRKLEER